MKIAILGNGQPYAIKKEIKNHGLIIATDGGANHCIKYKIKPDLIIGDLDSIKENTKKILAGVGIKKIEEQNTTDTEKALNYVKEKYGDKTEQLDLYWMASLQRMDHTIAAIFMMANYTDLPLTFCSKNFTAQIIKGKKELNNLAGRTISIFPFSQNFSAPEMTGFKWQMESRPSVSNIITNNKASIRLDEGLALLIINKKI